MRKDDLRPKRRSWLRRRVGKAAYTLARYALWLWQPFAARRQETPMEHVHAQHQTPLLRRLKDVDMQYQYNKIENLRLAAQRLNGVVLRPGEVFSYWRLIGKPTARKGYLEGIVLDSGSFRPGVGGGLCQMSNLIFWMALHTPLTVVERYRHSFDVFPDDNRTQPFGSGATCVYPYRDLMIRNDTDFDFQLCVVVGEQHLFGQWRASQPPQCRYEVVERGHRMDREYWGGFSRHNELHRIRYGLDGSLIAEEKVAENHALMMYAPFLQEGG